jgi:thiamine-phosphate pyrophosphorylase
MNFSKNNMLLYAVTDRSFAKTNTLYEQLEAALRGGVTLVQLREKHLDEAEFVKEAVEIKALCHSYNVPLIINDNLKVALQSDADGIHIGQDDMAAGDVRKALGRDKIIGVSAHNVSEAVEAERNGADYLGVGAAFATGTKTNARPIEHSEILAISKSVSIPICTIGGITRNNISLLEGCGTNGVALVSAIFGAMDIESECKELLQRSRALFGGNNL